MSRKSRFLRMSSSLAMISVHVDQLQMSSMLSQSLATNTNRHRLVIGSFVRSQLH